MSAKACFVMPQTWTAVCQVLDDFVAHAEQTNEATKGVVTRFHAAKIPKISVADYVSRIYAYARCSDSCIVLALIYLDRLVQKNQHVSLCRLNVHRYGFEA